MKSHGKIFKAYSVAVIVRAAIAFLIPILTLLSLKNKLSNSLIGLFADNEINQYISILLVITVFGGLVLLFLRYVEFSVQGLFSRIVEGEDSDLPIIRPGFVFGSKFYSVFSSVIITVYFIFTIVALIASFFLNQANKFLPLFVFLALAYYAFVIYIVYYYRYQTFSDIYSHRENSHSEINLTESLGFDKGLLRGYGIFSLVIYIMSAFAVALPMMFVLNLPSDIFGSTDLLLVILLLLVEIAFNVFSGIAQKLFFDDMKSIIENN